MTLDGSAVGRRIVVRHETGGVGPSGGPELNDVLGRVVAVDQQTVQVELRDGRIREIDLTAITTWKPVPERPARRRRAAAISADDLTRITSRGWPAIDSAQLGDWELRASRGFTGRGNSVAVHGSAGLPFVDAVDQVRNFYATHKIPALAQLVVGSSAEREFLDAGWVPKRDYYGGAVVQVADLHATYPRDREAVVSDVVDDEWLAAYRRADEDPVTAREVLQAPRTVGFVSIGTPVRAIARIVVTGEWAGISAVEVDPDARRQGLGRRIVDTSLAWAVEHGADKAYLQTMRSNWVALALYEPYGFVDHHDYRYLEPPSR
ncbi:hypothetical protein C6I20_11430 [Aeromicrobium sp. A1-2]|uniref:GNAT family N-acetyltransferase n=1 Tax=Aeromicrobium sp. A1-2 TaxID=2107713 RepID=UPI000E4FA9F8|nr:GNAT family N-acetyltransferase [Aeromicrobium sp. A1-2]AXT85738.1 hypothetical protein C6I20_11430 [Aeromicrobium sp. A1-2]